jgi:hypothetical protein
MPKVPPPRRCSGTPCRQILPAGTQLHRVHLRKLAAAEFSPLVADTLFGGGRFDPVPGDEYPYLYAGVSVRTALAEVLLRDLPFNDQGGRILPRAAVQSRQLSSVELGADLTLLTLTSSVELAAVCQDEWLIHAGPPDYPQTRCWARWLRQKAPWAHGLLWPSKRDLGGKAVLLFGDRCGPGDLRPGPTPPVDLDDQAGARWLNDTLAGYRTVVRPPLTRNLHNRESRTRHVR